MITHRGQILAILAFIVQFCNGAIGLITSVIPDNAVAFAAEKGVSKSVFIHFAVAGLVGFLQGFLPRVQPKDYVESSF